MSSIISHVYISNILKEKYKLGDEFLYGAILPDILHKAIPAQRREMTHYLRHGILYGSEGDYPDIERFIIENTEILPKSQMMQGYLAHLIEDMLWFSIYIPRMTIEKDKKTIIYTLGENISVREVPFGWKIEEDSLDGYYQIYIHGMTNSERDALENRPVS